MADARAGLADVSARRTKDARADSGSGWACTGSSSEMVGGGLPCVAQPTKATSINGKA